ncbi:MAG: hypothetical protein M3O46_19935 [Myxococcota bacterium]|nr:hypothetical protein [Myxococcota bacterium]
MTTLREAQIARSIHAPMARAFAAMPPHLNPIVTPSAATKLPAHLQPIANAIASDPELSAIATGASSASGGSPDDASDRVVGNQGTQHRLPGVRHQICGMAPIVFAGAGSATGVFSPQTRFKGDRLVIPSATVAGVTLSNMLVGTKPQYAAASVEASDMFEEQSTGGIWDLDLCDVGQKIQATFAATAAGTVYACIIGQAIDGKPYPRMRSVMKRIGFQNIAIGAGANFNVTIAPQVRFKTRRIILDDATAKYFVINSFNIGITPQFISGDPVPAAAFTELAQDMWLDFDEAYIGNVLTLNVTNFDAAAHNFQGALLGDIDPRDLASASNNQYQ